MSDMDDRDLFNEEFYEEDDKEEEDFLSGVTCNPNTPEDLWPDVENH